MVELPAGGATWRAMARSFGVDVNAEHAFITIIAVLTECIAEITNSIVDALDLFELTLQLLFLVD